MVMGGLGKLAKYGGIAAAALSAGVLEAMNYGRGLKQMSDKTGITVGRLSMMKRVLGDNGVEIESLATAAKKMDVNLIGALKGGNDPFRQIGLSAKELVNLDPGARLLAVGNAIASIEDPAAQTAAAVALLGKSGTEMLGMFKDTEGMAAAGGPLSKQAILLDKNAKIFSDVINNLRHAGTKMRGFFIGVASEVAKVVDNLTEGAGKLNFVEMGQKLGVVLKDAMKWGFALWEDPKGVMGYFWEVAKTKALELANWLHDAIERAFPGMAIAIEGAISKTIAWGKILVGYAVLFGDKLMEGVRGFVDMLKAGWERTGIPGFMKWLDDKNKANVENIEARKKAGKPVTPYDQMWGQKVDDFDWKNSPRNKMDDALAAQADRPQYGPFRPMLGNASGGAEGSLIIPGTSKGANLVAEGMAELAKNAKGAAEALESAKVGADHFGAKAQAEKAEAMRNKIALAVNKAEAKMKALDTEKKKPLPVFKPTKFVAQRSPLISPREYERYRTIAAAHGVTSLDGSPTRALGGTSVSFNGERSIGEVRMGDTARRKAFLRDEERKRLKGLTEVEALNDIVASSKETATATKKLAKEIAP